MIKNLVILITVGLVGAGWASEPVTVQVISAVYEKSITPEFDAKLKKTGLEIHKKIEADRYIVTLGAYKDPKSAQGPLKKARALVVKDAFIRPVNRHLVAEHAKVEPAKKVEPAVHHAKATAEHNVTVHAAAPAATTSAVATPAVIVAAPVTTPATPAIAAAPTVSAPSKPLAVSDCDRREMHKDEMAEAIHYYKNSPYHRFEPVLLRR